MGHGIPSMIGGKLVGRIGNERHLSGTYFEYQVTKSGRRITLKYLIRLSTTDGGFAHRCGEYDAVRDEDEP